MFTCLRWQCITGGDSLLLMVQFRSRRLSGQTRSISRSSDVRSLGTHSRTLASIRPSMPGQVDLLEDCPQAFRDLPGRIELSKMGQSTNLTEGIRKSESRFLG